MFRHKESQIGVVLINELAIGLIFAFVGYKIGVNKEKLNTKVNDYFDEVRSA